MYCLFLHLFISRGGYRIYPGGGAERHAKNLIFGKAKKWPYPGPSLSRGGGMAPAPLKSVPVYQYNMKLITKLFLGDDYDEDDQQLPERPYFCSRPVSKHTNPKPSDEELKVNQQSRIFLYLAKQNIIKSKTK